MPNPLNDTRICLFDGGVLRFPDLFAMYKKQISMFWTVEEVDLSKDAKQYEHAPENVKTLVNHILSFFSIADAIVMENISENFLDCVQAPEAKSFYAAQIFSESVHAEMYNRTILALIQEPEKQKRLLQNVPHFKSVKKKKQFAEKWMNSERPFEEKLIAFAMVEGLLFSASFASIYWLKTLNLFPGLVQSNELISRDENLHCDFAIKLHSLLAKKCHPKTIQRIVCDAVDCELVFVKESIGDGLDGLKADDMCVYVKFLADK